MSRKYTKHDEEMLTDIRKIAKIDGNKNCVDCAGKMPSYINFTHHTFVCTSCSVIHRELQFKIKAISATVFTADDVRAMQEGGNARHNALYMAHHNQRDYPIPNSSDIAKLRKFICIKYLDKRWYDEKATLPEVEEVVHQRRRPSIQHAHPLDAPPDPPHGSPISEAHHHKMNYDLLGLVSDENSAQQPQSTSIFSQFENFGSSSNKLSSSSVQSSSSKFDAFKEFPSSPLECGAYISPSCPVSKSPVSGGDSAAFSFSDPFYVAPVPPVANKSAPFPPSLYDKRNSNQGRVQSTSPSANTNPAPNSNIFDAFADITTTSPYDPPPPHGGYGYPPHHDDYKEYHEQQPVMNNFQQPGIYSEYSYQSGGHQQMPVAWNNDGIQQQGGFCQQHVFDDNGGRPFGCGEISSKSYEPTQMQCPTQKRGEVNSTIAAGPAQLMQPSVASLNPFDIW